MAIKKAENVRMCYGHNSDFFGCNGQKKISEFYLSWSRFSDGYVPYCKSCLQRLWDYWMKETNSEKMALYYCLYSIDTPFIKSVYEDTIKSKGKITLGYYLNELHKRSSNKDLYENFACTDVTDISMLGTKIASLEEQRENKKALEKKWGVQDTEEDYEFLEDCYKRYTETKEDISPQQEDLYRDLIRDRLTLRKINDGRYKGEDDISKVQTRIAKLMSTLKIDQFEVEKPKTLSEQSIFNKFIMLELTKPEEVYKNPMKYEDYNNRDKYYKDVVLRPTLNTLVDRKDFDLNLEDLERYEIDE